MVVDFGFKYKTPLFFFLSHVEDECLVSSLEVLLETKFRESFNSLQYKEMNNADKRKFTTC